MTPQQLLDDLFCLPTSHLDSLALSTVVVSLLHHQGEDARLMQGVYRGQPHHWVAWGPYLVDFRYPGLTSPEAGLRSPAECGDHYHGQPQSLTPIPKVLLPAFCGGDHAHFDHLAGKLEP